MEMSVWEPLTLGCELMSGGWLCWGETGLWEKPRVGPEQGSGADPWAELFRDATGEWEEGTGSSGAGKSVKTEGPQGGWWESFPEDPTA